MPLLSEVRQQQQQQGVGQMSQAQRPHTGTVSDPVAYPFPIQARYRGQPCNITILANIEGLSPAKEITFEDGTTNWVSFDDQDLIIVDTRVVPLSNQQQNQLLQGATNTRR